MEIPGSAAGFSHWNGYCNLGGTSGGWCAGSSGKDRPGLEYGYPGLEHGYDGPELRDGHDREGMDIGGNSHGSFCGRCEDFRDERFFPERAVGACRGCCSWLI